MLIQPTLDALNRLKLHGMAVALSEQMTNSIDLMEAFARTANGAPFGGGTRTRMSQSPGIRAAMNSWLPSAKHATTANVMTMSLMSFMSALMPWSGQPVIVVRSWLRVSLQPIFSSRSNKRTSPCRDPPVTPPRVMLPPVMAAAAAK